MKYFTMLIFFCIIQSLAHSSGNSLGMGIGGGGAMSGISYDPYKSGHMYIGTDMGLVYETFDDGKTWKPISQQKIYFTSDLDYAAHMGFDTKGNLYWAAGGCNPKTSSDQGETWTPMTSLSAMLPEKCSFEKIRIIR